MKRLLAAAAVALLAHAASFAEDMPAKKVDGMWVSPTGMSLYTFDKDSDGKSACAGQCVQLWPPVTVTSAPQAKDWSTVKRDDGTLQLAYHGKPVYLYSGDHKPGDKTGDNFKGVWHLVKD